MNEAQSLATLVDTLGYSFSDPALLEQALTHASAVAGGEGQTYQRLEFLGDSVLGLVIASILFKAYPEADEGELSRRLAALVRKETCAQIARKIGIGPYIRLGIGEDQTGGRRKQAILGDVCEAIIGAIYHDGGLEPAGAFIERHWAERIAEKSPRLKDAKTTLQEWTHANGRTPPHYRQVERTGPDHAPLFTIAVTVDGFEPARATGPNKRATEQEAAEVLLVREGVWRDEPE